MSRLLEFLRSIVCFEEEDYIDRHRYDSPQRITGPISRSDQTFLYDSAYESYQTSNSTQTSASYRPPAPDCNAISAAQNSEGFQNPAPCGNTGAGNLDSDAGNASSMERNHHVLDNASQTTCSPRASSMTPNSISSSFVKMFSSKPGILSPSQRKAAIDSMSILSSNMLPLSLKPIVSPSKPKLPSSSSHALPIFKPTLSPGPSTSLSSKPRVPSPPQPKEAIDSMSSSSSNMPLLPSKPIVSPSKSKLPSSSSHSLPIFKLTLSPGPSTSLSSKPRVPSPPQPKAAIDSMPSSSSNTPPLPSKPIVSPSKSKLPSSSSHSLPIVKPTLSPGPATSLSSKPRNPSPPQAKAAIDSMSSSSSNTPPLPSKPIVSPSKSKLPSSSSHSLPIFKPTLSPGPATSSSSKPRIPSPPQPKAAIDSMSSSSSSAPPLPSKPIVSPSKSQLPSSSPHSLPIFRPTLSPGPARSSNRQAQANYIWVQNGSLPINKIPKDIEGMFKKDIVPEVLQRPLSLSTYAEYFAALLYAEDYYLEKWSNFLLKKVPLVLEKATIHKRGVKEEKIFVAIKIDAVPEKQPFLLSRDFVLAKPTGKQDQTFKGVIYRAVKSTKVLVEFGDEFHSQYLKGKEYDVSFSCNRVCLKRAHQAVATAADPLFGSLLFPNHTSMTRISDSTSIRYTNNTLSLDQLTAVQHILNHHGPCPYLLEGSIRASGTNLSRAGVVVKEAVRGLYLHSLGTKILVCGPVNSLVDSMFQSLKSDIPEPEMFRVNAAFRDRGLVPDDILSSCLYDEECFVCPQLQELKQFRVVFTTFVSAFRLYMEGITAGHFSHIFLIDSSAASEPETMIPLANLANKKTSVIVTGEKGKHPRRVRSDIGRKNGLSVSYFQRLLGRKSDTC